ncbi:sensor histidine kinase [Poseidonocella sp. HB161398]|uniref:sensor histidine kinase n=1 Tax=Poseidonocella sp. HB161398 TaxID=2320855 RepID=UPI001486219B|nr:histidine kinase [Poseidonocella sp. HB161398]
MRRSEAEAAALRAELRFQQGQLDPHFLFNSLNTIATEIPDRPEVALEMTRAVSSYLRAGLDWAGEDICAFCTEMENVTDYPRIQQMRFEDRLHRRIDMEAQTLDMRVPRLILQSLAENAIKHGHKDRSGCYDLRITARQRDGGLSLAVVNAGRYAPGERSGTGLKNLRRPSAIAYPGRHRIRIVQDRPEVAVHLLLEAEPCYG